MQDLFEQAEAYIKAQQGREGDRSSLHHYRYTLSEEVPYNVRVLVAAAARALNPEIVPSTAAKIVYARSEIDPHGKYNDKPGKLLKDSILDFNDAQYATFPTHLMLQKLREIKQATKASMQVEEDGSLLFTQKIDDLPLVELPTVLLAALPANYYLRTAFDLPEGQEYMVGNQTYSGRITGQEMRELFGYMSDNVDAGYDMRQLDQLRASRISIPADDAGTPATLRETLGLDKELGGRAMGGDLPKR